MYLTCKCILSFGLFYVLGSLTTVAQEYIALSRVGTYKSEAYQLGNSEKVSYKLLGKDADAFLLQKNEENIYSLVLKSNLRKGLYRAKLEESINGEKKNHVLNGIFTEKLEGHYEPSLYKIFKALGVDVDLVNDKHTYSTEAGQIGDSLAIEEFRVAKGTKEILVTLLARYSPVGTPEIGFAMDCGKITQKIGYFSDVSKYVPDAHQRIFPHGLKTNKQAGTFSISVENCPTHLGKHKKFGFYYIGKHFTSLTYAGKSKGASIRHTARVFKVSTFMGRDLKNAYIICYEEAKNGDYQDAIILVEGIEPAE